VIHSLGGSIEFSLREAMKRRVRERYAEKVREVSVEGKAFREVEERKLGDMQQEYGDKEEEGRWLDERKEEIRKEREKGLIYGHFC